MKATDFGRFHFCLLLSVYLITLLDNTVEALPVGPNLEIKEGTFSPRSRNDDSTLDLSSSESKTKNDVVGFNNNLDDTSVAHSQHGLPLPERENSSYNLKPYDGQAAEQKSKVTDLKTGPTSVGDVGQPAVLGNMSVEISDRKDISNIIGDHKSTLDQSLSIVDKKIPSISDPNNLLNSNSRTKDVPTSDAAAAVHPTELALIRPKPAESAASIHSKPSDADINTGADSHAGDQSVPHLDLVPPVLSSSDVSVSENHPDKKLAADLLAVLQHGQHGTDTPNLPSKYEHYVTTIGPRSQGNDLPEEFQVDPQQGLSGSDDSKSLYSSDEYLEVPADNVDKLEDDAAHSPTTYEDGSDIGIQQNNQRIMDDNNEQAVYNGDGDRGLEVKTGGDLWGDRKDSAEDDEDYPVYNDDDDDHYRESDEKGGEYNEDINNKTDTKPAMDLWYDTDSEDGQNKDLDEDTGDQNPFLDTSDIQIDHDLDFKLTHPYKPQLEDPDNLLQFKVSTGLKEGLVEYKLLKNHNSLNAPSSVVLFYTWIILIALVTVLMLSIFRYRCQGIITASARSFRNGGHGNTRPGEENKRLLDSVYE